MVKNQNSNFESKLADTICIEKALQLINYGDIILFRTKSVLSAIQRKLTDSEYDHVAIVIRFPFNDNKPESLYLLESTGDGVHTYPLHRRLLAWYYFSERLSIRRLNFNRTSELGNKLVKFVDRVDGFKYGYFIFYSNLLL